MANINAKIRNAETISAKNITIGNISTTDIGLGNVNNTSDADKPISTLTQAALNLKANQTTTYTKTEVDTNIAAIVDGAPETLNTLKELATALNDNTSFSTTVTNLIANKAEKTNAQFIDTATFANDVVITDDLTVDTNTLFVDASRSNVGIGTITPDVNLKLDVAGSFRATGASYLTGALYVDTNTLFVDSSTNKVVIGDNTQNKQKGKLTIAGSSGSGTGLALTHHTSTTDFAEMYYRGNTTGSPFIITRSQTGGSEIILYRSGDINLNGGFGTSSNSNTSKTPDNVGIGVNAATKLNNSTPGTTGTANTNGKPTNKLHIFEKSGLTMGILTNPILDNATFRIEETTSTNQNLYMDGNSIYATGNLQIGANAIRDIIFYPGKAESLRLKADGKVGIGTDTPTQKLDVSGNILASGNVTANTITATNTLQSIGQFDCQTALFENTVDFDDQVNFNGSVEFGEEVVFNSDSNVSFGDAVIFNDKVGIGTSAARPLHIKSISSDTAYQQSHPLMIEGTGDAIIEIRAGTGTSKAGIDFGDNTNTTESGGQTVTDINNGGSGPGAIIYENADNKMRFKTNNVDAITIDSDGNVGIGTTTPSKKLSVHGKAKITPVSGRGLWLYSSGSNNQAVSARVEGPVTVGHDLFQRSGFTDGFADGSNHFHSLIDINRIEQEPEGDVKNTQRVQERYYAIQDNLLPNNKAVFWAQHRVARPISTTVIDTSTATLDVSLLQNSGNRNANNQVFFVSNTTPLNKSEELEITLNSHTLSTGDNVRMEFGQSFAGPIVAAQIFGKVTTTTTNTFKVELYGGNYKTTSEVPLGTSQTALTFDEVTLETIGTNTIVQSGNETNLQLFSRTNFTPIRAKDETLKATWSVAHGLVKNEHCTLITDGRGDLIVKQAAYVLDPDPDSDGLSAILVYGRRIKQFDLGSFTAFGSSNWTLHKGSIDGIHDDTLGDNLINFNANNHGDYTAYQIGPGSQTDADCIAIGKNVYNKDASTIKIGYDNAMLDIRSDGIIVDGTVIAGEPTAADNLATKNYVDNQIGGVVVPVLGIADTNTVIIDSTTVAADEVAIFTSSGLKSRTYADIFETSVVDLNVSDQVAIGTQTPQAGYELTLHQDPATGSNSKILLRAASTGFCAVDFGDADDNDIGSIIYHHADNSMRFDTADAEAIRIDSSQNVGIGTNSPSVKLEVSGDALISGDLTVNGTTTTVNQTNIDVSDNIIGLNRGVATNASDSGLIIERGSAGDNAAIIWDESVLEFVLGTTTSDASSIGNISVTPSPLRLDSIKLESGPTLTSGASSELTITTDYGYLTAGPRNANYAHIQTDREKFYFNKRLIVDEGIISAYNDHDLILTTGSSVSTSSTGVFIKNSTHEVGIGTNSPTAKLDVSGYVRADFGNYLGYKNADVMDYDSSTTTSTFYWIKVGSVNSSNNNTRLSVEVNTFGDNNYPRNQCFTVTANTYNVSSLNLSVLKNYGSSHNDTIEAKVDSNLDLWVKKNISWTHAFLIKPIVISGGATFNEDYTGANRISTEPSGGTPIIKNDRSVRFAQSDLTTVTHEHSDKYFRVDGDPKLTVKADSGNVGIGTTLPDANLHVVGAGTIGQNPANFDNATVKVTNGSVNLYVDANEVVSDDNLHLQTTKNDGYISLATDDSSGSRVNIANASASGFAIGKGIAAATRTLDVTGTAVIRGYNTNTHRPLLILDTPKGANGNQQTRLTIGTDLTSVPFEIQTATSDNVFVSNDYRIEKNTNGASKHEFRIADSNILEVDSSGISITGTASANTAAAGTNSTVLATTEFVTTAVANNPPSGIFATNVVVNGADFEVNKAAKRLVDGQEPTNPSNTTRRRALVHATGDTLDINYDGDYTGGVHIHSDVVIGSPSDLTDANFLYFNGVTGDSPYDHTALVERLYDGQDNAELLIFKGNDKSTSGILDRIRYRSAEHIFQTIDQAEEVDEHIADDPTGSTNTRMIIDKNGNVGIGTTTPISNLHISSSTSGDCTLILEADTDNNNEGDNPRIIFAQDAGAYQSSIGQAPPTGGSPDNALHISNSVVVNGGILFETGTANGTNNSLASGGYTNATERMRITDDGKVGIGTTSPNTELDVSGDITADSVAISCAATSGADFAVQVDKLKVNANTGEVGINKTPDSGVDLDVNGIIKASGAVTAGQLLLGDDWDTNSPAGGDKIYIKDSDAQNYSEFALSGTGGPDVNNNRTAVKSDFPLLISTDSNETSNPTSHGILLYNANGTAGTFSPSILFGTRESDAQGGDPTHQYRVVSGGIYCRTPLGVGGESAGHYGDGELIFATAGTENGSTTTNSQGPSQRMVIDRSGRVGINNLTPSEVLDVTGNIATSGNVTASGDISAKSTIVVSGSTNTNYNGTYVYDSSEDIWYNNTNTDATTGTNGYFFYSDTDNRWQFGSTNANAKAASGSTSNSFLSPSTSEAVGFWSINENTNWTAGNATVTGQAQDMSFAGSDITATGNVIASDPTSDEHLATKRYVDSKSALPTISVFSYYNNSVGTGSEYLTTYTDQDSGNNLALAGTSLKTPLPATTGDKTGEFTVPSSGQSLVEIHFHCDESDIDRSDDFRFWILDENRDTTNGAIAVAAYKANSGSSYYKYRNAISWSGYIAPGGKFSVYIQAITPTAACEVQGSVKITTYDV